MSYWEDLFLQLCAGLFLVCDCLSLETSVVGLGENLIELSNKWRRPLEAMGSMKFDLEKFLGKSDFGLWRIKMRAMLVQQGLVQALKGESDMPTSLSGEQKTEILKKIHSAIILCLGDKALRQVAKEKYVAAVWIKLESLYMTKSLANRLFMKHRLHSFKMKEDLGLSDQVDEFIKILDDLENLEIKLDEEDKALLLLNALPKSYENFRDTMLYGREQSISLEEVQLAIHSKELQKKKWKKNHHKGKDSQFVVNLERKNKEVTRANQYPKFKQNSSVLSATKRTISKVIAQTGKRWHNINQKKRVKLPLFQKNFDDAAEVLAISNQEKSKEWILDSGCSFHMCPNKSWFETLTEEDEGLVLLGNNKTCRIK